MLNLRDRVKDQITGFSGVVTGRCEYITGCTQLLVQPPVKDNGDFVESRWVDEDRLALAGEPIEFTVKTAGPDKPAPKR